MGPEEDIKFNYYFIMELVICTNVMSDDYNLEGVDGTFPYDAKGWFLRCAVRNKTYNKLFGPILLV